MSLHTLPTGYEPSGYDEQAEMISQARGQVLDHESEVLQLIETLVEGRLFEFFPAKEHSRSL